MPTKSGPQPGGLARAASAEIRAEMARKRITGIVLAEKIGRSQNYVAKRLRDDVPLTLNDMEQLAGALGTTYERLLTATLARMKVDEPR